MCVFQENSLSSNKLLIGLSYSGIDTHLPEKPRFKYPQGKVSVQHEIESMKALFGKRSFFFRAAAFTPGKVREMQNYSKVFKNQNINYYQREAHKK